MAKLKITLNGETINEYTLDQDKESILGRGTQCDIVLAHPKVSRQHAKIFFDGQNWICKVLSKFGNMSINGHVISDITLTNGANFSIPPFEISFLEAADDNAATGEVINSDKTINTNDHTSVGQLNLKGVLRRLDEDGSVKDEMFLEKDEVVAGRSSSCDINIQDTHASRRHFSIHYDGQKYILKDLESANKTYVNGNEITEHTLESGDEISVGKERHRFDLVHPDFENLPMVITEESGVHSGHSGQTPAVIKYRAHATLSFPLSLQGLAHFAASKVNTTKNPKIKIGAIALILVFILYSALVGNKNIEPPRTVAGHPLNQSGGPTQLDRLPPEQKKYIDETYNLALNLYTTGKYDLAAIEVTKVVQTVGDYKDAKNIQALCQQAIEIKKQQEEGEQRDVEQQALKQKVTDILDGCDNLFKAKQYAKIPDCVAPVKELDPENERVVNIEVSARQEIDKIESSKEYHSELARQKTQAKKSYAKAMHDVAAKRFPAALEQLNRVERLNFNDTEGLKEKAKQDIAIVKTKMLKESQTLVQDGKGALSSKNYSDAINKFNQALVLAPFNNEARTMRESARRELHLDMKNMYSESVIEEDLGNIESAKKKWAAILKQDEKTDPYYEKAQLKLRKYEK